MYIKIRQVNEKEGKDLIINISKKAKVRDLREKIATELNIKVDLQKLLYKGKILCDDNELHELNVQLNDIIQLLICAPTDNVVNSESNDTKEALASASKNLIDLESDFYKVGDQIDFQDVDGAWWEGTIIKIFKNEKIDDSKIPSKEPDLLFRCLQQCKYYPIELDANFDQIRPRSYYTYKPSELTNGMMVLVTYNIDKPTERGFWYDFQISSTSSRFSIKGTLIIGNKLHLKNISIKFNKECLRIQNPQPLSERQDLKLVNKLPLRKVPVDCLNCKDNPKRKCNQCGCQVCHAKNNLENMLLCDECDCGYHIGCLSPPLMEIPSTEHWYCPRCKINENEIVKAGEKFNVSNKKSKMPSSKGGKTRDWGSGVACVGRSRVCTIVGTDHFGVVPGIEVGTCWRYRFQVSEVGIHRPMVAGIHGRSESGAFSVVLSGGYKDDLDEGDHFIYSGSGGRDLSGNKRMAAQSFDQKLLHNNKSLAMSCFAEFNDIEGAESQDWKKGKPIRVVRNSNGRKHSAYAPKVGNRYDGIYKIVKYYPEKGQSGYIVWKFLFKRDDPDPAPWHDDGHEYEVIYPDGYLEAEAQKEIKRQEAAKNKKKRKGSQDLQDGTNETVKQQKYEPYKLTIDILDQIKLDENNTKVWNDCTEVLNEGKNKFLAKVQELFMCVCCQDLVYFPVTTECKHNICKNCLDRSFGASIYNCPHCRFELGKDYKLVINDVLATLLIKLFPGYNNSR